MGQNNKLVGRQELRTLFAYVLNDRINKLTFSILRRKKEKNSNKKFVVPPKRAPSWSLIVFSPHLTLSAKQ